MRSLRRSIRFTAVAISVNDDSIIIIFIFILIVVIILIIKIVIIFYAVSVVRMEAPDSMRPTRLRK